MSWVVARPWLRLQLQLRAPNVRHKLPVPQNQVHSAEEAKRLDVIGPWLSVSQSLKHGRHQPNVNDREDPKGESIDRNRTKHLACKVSAAMPMGAVVAHSRLAISPVASFPKPSMSCQREAAWMYVHSHAPLSCARHDTAATPLQSMLPRKRTRLNPTAGFWNICRRLSGQKDEEELRSSRLWALQAFR